MGHAINTTMPAKGVGAALKQILLQTAAPLTPAGKVQTGQLDIGAAVAAVATMPAAAAGALAQAEDIDTSSTSTGPPAYFGQAGAYTTGVPTTLYPAVPVVGQSPGQILSAGPLRHMRHA